MRIKKTLLFLGIAGAGVAAGLIFFSGALTKPLLESALRTNGFPNAHIENVRILPKGMLIEHISLDGDEFSAIEAAQITGSLSELLFERKISSINLKNVEISGEVDESGHYIIAGWDAGAPGESGSAGLLIENISVDGMTLDFETPEGAIRVEGKLALQSSADKTRNFQASLWGKQKQLSLNANASGKILPDGQWSSDIELLEGRVDMDAVKATRANGQIKLRSVSPQGIAYEGKMAAGGVRIKDTPFQDFEVAFDSNKSETLQFKTSPTAHNGIVIAGRILNQTPLALEASVSVEKIADLESLFSLKKEDTAWLRQLAPFEISARAPLPSLSEADIPVNWSLITGGSRQAFKGNAVYSREDQKLTGSVADTKLSAATISGLLPVKEKSDIDLTEGSLSITGNFETILNQSPLKVTGKLQLTPENIGGVWQDYPFNGVRGKISLSQLWPWQTEKNQTVTVETIGTGINLTNGKLSFDADQKNGYAVHEAGFDFAKGRIFTEPFKWSPAAKENSVLLRLENVDMATLAESAAARGFVANGTLGGTLPVVLTDKGIVFKDGQITSQGEGSFKYAPETFPAALQGDDSRMETVRLALSDFRYSDLQISINGALDGDLQTAFKATGKNPVFEDRAINLNINLEGALVPALQQALQPGRIADRIEKSVTGE